MSTILLHTKNDIISFSTKHIFGWVYDLRTRIVLNDTIRVCVSATLMDFIWPHVSSWWSCCLCIFFVCVSFMFSILHSRDRGLMVGRLACVFFVCGGGLVVMDVWWFLWTSSLFSIVSMFIYSTLFL